MIRRQNFARYAAFAVCIVLGSSALPLSRASAGGYGDCGCGSYYGDSYSGYDNGYYHHRNYRDRHYGDAYYRHHDGDRYRDRGWRYDCDSDADDCYIHRSSRDDY